MIAVSVTSIKVCETGVLILIMLHHLRMPYALLFQIVSREISHEFINYFIQMKTASVYNNLPFQHQVKRSNIH